MAYKWGLLTGMILQANVRGEILLMAEIRRSPVEVGSLSHSLSTRFYTSQVVQDFFHQQYDKQIQQSKHPKGNM